MDLQRICVFCASSSKVDEVFFAAAREVGREIAGAGLTVVYGGGGTGLMGAVADGALERDGEVIGIIPDFMVEREWGHSGVTTMHIVKTMHERVAMMIEMSHAFVALPGGCGTLDELFQAMTWRRLGLHNAPLVIVNTGGYYDALIAQLERCIGERFMHENHEDLWRVVESPGELLDMIRSAPGPAGDPLDIAHL